MEVEISEAEKYNTAGNLAVIDEEYEKAIRFYNYALKENDKEPKYYANRCAAFLGMGDRSRALDDAETTIDMNKTWYKGYSRKASVYLYLRKYKDCIDLCKTAITLAPKNKQEGIMEILRLADKGFNDSKLNDFSSLDDAMALADDDDNKSRLKQIRENKKLESFLSEIDISLKPVFDTTKDRKVNDDEVMALTPVQHVDRLAGAHARLKNLNPYRVFMLPITASEEDIKQRFIKLANMVHPDKCLDPRANQAFDILNKANDMMKDKTIREECVKLIKGTTRSVEKKRAELMEKGMKLSDLPEEKSQIETEIMKVFAQNDLRKERAKQYMRLYERREKEKQEEKRQKIVQEIKIHREWMDTTDVRANTWREYQERSKGKKRDVTMDNLSGETDHDKRKREEEKAYYTALGEEYKINWRYCVSSVQSLFFMEQSVFWISLAVIVISTVVILSVWWKRGKKDLIRTVWVIGASSGIGREVAIQYALQGKRVILSSRSEDRLKELQNELVNLCNKDSSHFPVLLVDMEKDDCYDDISRKVEELVGGVDVLVVSSGLGIRAFNDETTPAIEKLMLQTNYTGPILLAKSILPYMRNRRLGSIVFISSIQGLLSIPARSSYSAAKHALQGYCDSLRAEESMHGIDILCVSPAYVKTNHSLHSIRGDGSSYNRMDATTEKGMEPKDLAVLIQRAVINKAGNVIIAPLWMKIVVVLQALFPRALSVFMSRKAQKARYQ